MLLADVVCTWRRESRAHVRTAASLVSGLANNLPDSDIVYSWLDGPKPLGALLHHRGHTHTLLLALPSAWLLGVVAWRWFLRRNPDATARERRLLLGLSLVGPCLHLLMDFGNNYGVHPFWPIYSGWLYGDSLFIVEPLWLAILVPCLARRARRWLAVLLWIVLGALLVVAWFVPFVPSGARLALIATTSLSWFVARSTSDVARSRFAVGACLGVAALFMVGASRAKAELRAAASVAFPALTLHDVVTTPLPANPSCWEGLIAGEQGGVYRVLRASVALAPFQDAHCPAGAGIEPSAPVKPLERASRNGVRWISSYDAEIARLTELRRSDCRFRALLRFARLPYVASSGAMAGDLRYDRQPGRDFSDVELAPPASQGRCPRFVPGWAEPRAELFSP